jgi:hypothetical protein
MSRIGFKGFVLLIVGVVSSAYASGARPPQKEVGIYDLFFIVNFANELVLRAHVSDSLGNPATDGVVLFEYCSYPGRSNDITQPDEAPSSACADGSAKWNRLARVPVTMKGDASLFFGVVQVVPVIGFRYAYSNGSEVADWVIDPVDWVR